MSLRRASGAGFPMPACRINRNAAPVAMREIPEACNRSEIREKDAEIRAGLYGELIKSNKNRRAFPISSLQDRCENCGNGIRTCGRRRLPPGLRHLIRRSVLRKPVATAGKLDHTRKKRRI